MNRMIHESLYKENARLREQAQQAKNFIESLSKEELPTTVKDKVMEFVTRFKKEAVT